MRLTSCEYLPEFVTGIRTKRRHGRLPRNPDALPRKQKQQEIPNRCTGCNISAHPVNRYNWIGPSATGHIAAIIAEYARIADRILSGSLIVTAAFAMPVQTTSNVTVRTRHKIQPLCKLVIFLNVANISGVLGTYIWPTFLCQDEEWYYAFRHIKRKKLGSIQWAGVSKDWTALTALKSKLPNYRCLQRQDYDTNSAQNGTFLR